MADISDSEFIEPDELDELEKDATDLQQQLDDVRAADMTSASITELVKYIQKEEEKDKLVFVKANANVNSNAIGDEMEKEGENGRWKELIIREEPEPKEVEQKRCCPIS